MKDIYLGLIIGCAVLAIGVGSYKIYKSSPKAQIYLEAATNPNVTFAEAAEVGEEANRHKNAFKLARERLKNKQTVGQAETYDEEKEKAKDRQREEEEAAEDAAAERNRVSSYNSDDSDDGTEGGSRKRRRTNSKRHSKKRNNKRSKSTKRRHHSRQISKKKK